MHQRNAQATNRSWNEPEDTQSGLPLANDFKRKQQMEKQRNQEYNEFLKQVFSAQHVLVFFLTLVECIVATQNIIMSRLKMKLLINVFYFTC